MKKILSLFSGCGGMDLGFLGGFEVHKNCIIDVVHKVQPDNKNNWEKLPRTSFDLVFANDILDEAKSSYVPFFKKIGQEHPFYTESIVDLVEQAELGKFSFPQADVVLGGFPCQDFSVAGKRLGLKSNKSHIGSLLEEGADTNNRGMLYTWMKKVIELTHPKMFIAENVKGLVSLGDVKKVIEHDFR